jgi:hypothetical protein
MPRRTIGIVRITAPVASTNLAAPVMKIQTAMESGNRERALLYHSRRWRKERAVFLRLYRFCACGARAVLVDHRDGHQRVDWRVRVLGESRNAEVTRDSHT